MYYPEYGPRGFFFGVLLIKKKNIAGYFSICTLQNNRNMEISLGFWFEDDSLLFS